MTGLSVPEVAADDDTLGAALKYAAAGWYVVPVDPRTKNPGSVLHKAWQTKSSRDPEQIVGWFAGTGYALALHVGRSGAVAFDVDDPTALPQVMLTAFRRDQSPHQSTRVDVPGRGHVLYASPADRNLGNGAGKLGKAWGEVRGRNGVIVVAPSPHEKASVGGRYDWVRTGPVPVLPPELADLMPDTRTVEDTATDAEVVKFLAEHGCDEHPGLLRAVLSHFEAKVSQGASRHHEAASACAWAMREARAGLYPGQRAHDELREAFTASLGRSCGPKSEKRDPEKGEWAGIVSWAVAQALADDVDSTRKAADKQVSDYAARQDDPFGDLLPAPAPLDAGDDLSPSVSDATDEHPDDPTLAERVAACYRIIDWHQAFAKDRSEPDWIVEPLLERGRVISNYSPPKTGKSLLWLEIGAALSRGLAVFGNPAREPLRVLYVDLENTEDDIVERLVDLGHGPGDLDNLRYLSFPDLPALDSPTGGRHLTAIAEAHNAEVVIIDTVSRVIEGGEDDADTFRALYRHAILPLKRARRSVVRLDHSGKDLTRGQRGSSAKADDVDAVWSLVHRSGAKYDLRRTHSRTNHGADHVEVTRLTGPLRHQVTSTGTASEALSLVTELDRLGVPNDAGRTSAREALKGAGVKAATAVLVNAIKHRQGRAGLSGIPRTASPTAATSPGPSAVRSTTDSQPDSRSKDCPGQSADSSDSEPQSNTADLSDQVHPVGMDRSAGTAPDKGQPSLLDIKLGDLRPCARRCGELVHRYGEHSTGPVCATCLGSVAA